MKKKGLLSMILGCVMALSVTLTSCQANVPELPPEAAVESQGVPLGNFEIKAPAFNSETADVNPHVSWTAERNAEEYLVSVSKDSTFSEIVAEETTWRTYTAISQTLDYSTKYYLRIYAMKEDEETGKDIALSYRSTVFTTIADHATPVPDNTVTKTIHDFENFEDDYAIGEYFAQHTGGDPLVPTLAAGEGVNGSTAMKLSYTKADKGWSAVMSINTPEKKNWSGAKGIRMWIDSDGNGGTFTVSIGKRGYQRWSASMTLNATDPTYVTIPFSEFEDAGGGDGIWEMSGIVRLWFYFHAKTGTNAATILVDDITIGADALHSTDTREDIAAIPKKALVVDTPFETFDVAADGNSWTLVYDTNTNKDLTKSIVTTGTSTGIKVYDPSSFGTNTYTLKASGYDFKKADLTGVNGFRMKVNSVIFNNTGDATGPVATVQVKIGSAGNYYTTTKDIFNYNNSYGQVPYIVCDFAAMKLVDGCEGALDKSKIDTLEITVTGLYADANAHQFVFDDMEFYTATCGAKGAAFTSDFSDGSTQNWGTATFADGIATRTATGSAFSLTYKTASTSWPNYQNSYAIRFRFKTTNVKNISVRLYNDVYASKGIKTATNIEVINDGEYHDYIVYFADMIEATSTTHTSMKFQQIQFYTNCLDSTGGTIVCEKVELLIG